VYKFHNSTYC